MTPRRRWLLGGLLLGGFLIRCPGLDRPYLGHFTGITALYGMVARNFARDGELIQPKFDLLIDGEPSLRMLDYPVNCAVTAGVSRLTGLGIDPTGRLLSILVTVGSAWLLWDLVRRREGAGGEPIAWIAAAVFLASPLTIVYGQALHAEPWATCALLAGLRLLSMDAGERGRWSGPVSWLLLGLAVVMRIQLAAFLAFWCVAVLCGGGTARRLPRLAAGLAAGLALPLLWYGYTYRMATTDHRVASSLFHQVDKGGVGGSVLLSADFAKGVTDTGVGRVVGPLLFPFAVLGLFTRRDRPRGWAVAAGGLACAALVIPVLPDKVMDGDYYLYALVPFAAWLAGRGLVRVGRAPEGGGDLRRGWVALGCVAFLINLRFAAGPAFVTPEADRGIPEAAARVREVVPPDARLVASHGAAGDFLYYCDRRGWSFAPVRLEGDDTFYVRTNFFGLWEPSRFARRRDAALAGPAAWLEYLRSEEGATHLAVYRPETLGEGELAAHLEGRYPRILDDPLVAVWDLRR